MEALLHTINLLILLATLVAALRFAAAVRRLQWRPPAATVEPAAGGAPRPAPRVSIVVPARNEERDLEASLRSLLAQEGVELEVVVVNDHSVDGTGEIAERVARGDARVRVLHDPPLAAGWLGKPNAMERGAALATAPYLLFSDADIIHRPGVLAAAVRELERDGLALLSLLPRFIFETLWENVLVPGFVAGMAVLLGPGIEDPRSRRAMGAGAFLLVRADRFRAAGGFEPIKSEMLDDVELARLLKARGGPVRLRLAPELLEVRLFKTNRDAFWGATKNVLAFVWAYAITFPIALAGTFTVYGAPFAALAAGIAAGDPLLAASGVAVYVSQYVVLLQSRELCRFRPLKLLFFPLVAISFSACLLRAVYYRLARRAVLWRGRAVRVR